MAASARTDRAGASRQARHPNPTSVAAKIVEQAASAQLQADAVTTRTKSRLMLALVSQLLPLIEQIAQYDKEIDTLFLTHEDHELFESLPRAGNVWLHDCWQKSAMIAALSGCQQSASSGGTSPCSFKAACTPKPIAVGVHQTLAQCFASIRLANDAK